MIQRIQTLWLLIAAACAFAGFKFSFYSGTKLNIPVLQGYDLNASSTFLLMLVTIAVGGLAFVNIFLFKKRTIQLWLCVLGILLEALLIFLYYKETLTIVPGHYLFTAALQGVVLFAFLYAMRGIRKDSKLLKESDRLR